MRGRTVSQVELFSYVPLESRVPRGHPLRKIKEMVDPILERLSPEFEAIYSHTGRPSIPPEHLLRALLLQVLFTIRSEIQLVENIRYNLLYRWFVGLAPDDHVWEETVFSKNRSRLLEGDVANGFFEEVLKVAKARDLLSKDHFTVDGTIIEAWAGQKSFKLKDGEKVAPKKDDDDSDPGNPSVDFHGEKRCNDTHQSTTDPGARLYKKARGQEAKLAYLGHVIMENRNGLAVSSMVTQATGTAERDASFAMAIGLPGNHQKTLGGDKNYDTKEHVEELRVAGVTPHVAQNLKRRGGSAIDDRTARHAGYEISQKKRKLVEEIFGRLKTVGLMRKPHFRGQKKMGFFFTLALSAYNLVRIRNLSELRA
jgi:transposase/IS5 family transposase